MLVPVVELQPLYSETKLVDIFCKFAKKQVFERYRIGIIVIPLAQ